MHGPVDHDQSESQTTGQSDWLLFSNAPTILERNPCTLCQVFLVASKEASLSRVHLLGVKAQLLGEVQSRNECTDGTKQRNLDSTLTGIEFANLYSICFHNTQSSEK